MVPLGRRAVSLRTDKNETVRRVLHGRELGAVTVLVVVIMRSYNQHFDCLPCIFIYIYIKYM